MNDAPDNTIPSAHELLTVDELLSYKLVRLQRLIDRCQARNAERFGLTLPEIRLLLLIRRHPGHTLAEVLRGTIVDSGNSSRNANSLVRAGFLYKEQDEDDARKARLFLTDKGDRLVAEAQGVWQEFNRQLMDVLPNEDRVELLHHLDNLMEKLSQVLNEPRQESTS